MNCCNEYGDCRQGRDCPVRKGSCREPDNKPDNPDDPDDGDHWMNFVHNLFLGVVAIFVIFLLSVSAGFIVGKHWS